MVDEGAFNPVWDLFKGNQLRFDLITNLRKYQKFYTFKLRKLGRLFKIITQIGDKTRKKHTTEKNEKSAHLIKVGDLLQRDFLLFLDGVSHRPLNSLQQEVKRSRVLSTHQAKPSRYKHTKKSSEAKKQP